MIDLKVELGVSAERIIQQVKINNSLAEEQIAQAINESITELTESGQLLILVKAATKRQLLDTANKAVVSWEVQQKIQNVIADRITEKLAEYGDAVATKIINELTNKHL